MLLRILDVSLSQGSATTLVCFVPEVLAYLGLL